MISASKSTLSLNNLNILMPKVTKNLTNLRKKFCESPPCALLCFLKSEQNSLLIGRAGLDKKKQKINLNKKQSFFKQTSFLFRAKRKH